MGLKHSCQRAEVRAGSDQGPLHVRTAYLRMSNIGEQRVAEAFPPGNALWPSALRNVCRQRLGSASVSDRALSRTVGLPEITEIADARPAGIDSASDSEPSTCTILNGKSVGEARGSVTTRASPAGYARQYRLLVGVAQPRFGAKREDRARLNTHSTDTSGFVFSLFRGCRILQRARRVNRVPLACFGSTRSRSPYTGSPAGSSCGLPRGGALWPPAVGPSTTKPSTLPFAFFTIVAARVFEETWPGISAV